jgi:syntaxin of plants SYP6
MPIFCATVLLQLNEVQQKMSRFHGLTATNPERKDIAKAVDTECSSIVWQVLGGPA